MSSTSAVAARVVALGTLSSSGKADDDALEEDAHGVGHRQAHRFGASDAYSFVSWVRTWSMAVERLCRDANWK
jgi:hypothetical protein